MKKHFLFTLCLFSYLQFFGQFDARIIAGLNYTNLGDIEVPFGQIEEKSIVTYHLGGGFGGRISEKLSLNGELLFNVKGGERISTSVGEPPTALIIRYNYLSLPIYGKIHFNKFNFGLGGESSFCLGGKFKYRGDRNYYIINKKRALYPNSSFDFSLLGFMGFNIDEKFTLSVRYIYGLRYTFKYPMYLIDEEKLGGDKEYNRLFQVSLSYILKKT